MVLVVELGVVVVVEDMVLVEGAVIAKVIEVQVLHYVKYQTGNVGSIGSSGSNSRNNNRIVRITTVTTVAYDYNYDHYYYCYMK